MMKLFAQLRYQEILTGNKQYPKKKVGACKNKVWPDYKTRPDFWCEIQINL